MNETSVDRATFRQAMSRFPAGVTIVTTKDAEGRAWGFTASSFCSLSLEPPLVLVCLANDARSAPAFRGAESYVIHVTDQRQRDLVMRFASKSVEDKFADLEYQDGPMGHPELPDAIVTLRCRAENVIPAGDHVILVGHVVDALVNESGVPLVHGDRSFWRLEAHE
jgi:flavin reductase ActVB